MYIFFKRCCIQSVLIFMSVRRANRRFGVESTSWSKECKRIQSAVWISAVFSFQRSVSEAGGALSDLETIRSPKMCKVFLPTVYSIILVSVYLYLYQHCWLNYYSYNKKCFEKTARKIRKNQLLVTLIRCRHDNRETQTSISEDDYRSTSFCV